MADGLLLQDFPAEGRYVTAFGFAVFIAFGTWMVLGGSGAAGTKPPLQDKIDNAVTVITGIGFLLMIAGITVKLWRTMP
jgi:hypothetical protein